VRHGRKSSSQRFDGYKTHISIEKESEYITNVVHTPGNVHDSEALSPLIKEQTLPFLSILSGFY
jgi:IS5 family transposase